MSITVVIVDDHPIVRAGVRTCLEEQGSIDVLAEGCDSGEARQLCQQHQPDVLILDYSMPGSSASETIAQVREYSPKTRVLMLSAYNEDAYIRQIMRVGVAGYLLKEEAPDTLVKAVHAVHAGAAWFSKSVADKFMQWQFGHAPEVAEASLTRREKDILGLIAKGWNNSKVATHLGLAEQTVRNYTSSLYEKIKVQSRAEAVVWALNHGFAESIE